MLTKALYRRSSTDMEAECAAYWNPADAISEESEMIAHLQWLLWSSSEVDLDPSLCSFNDSFSFPSFSPFPIINNESSALVRSTPNAVLECQLDTLASANVEKAGNKRKIQKDERMNHGEEEHAAPSAKRALKKSERDSQSRYAKQKRREKINSRLRILQELIPNGTNVDISTMLEGAVEYVKFLHLQIKLLSSDEMWMYAPLAYHGINIGMHLNR